MRDAKPVKFELGKVFNGRCELLVTGRTEMRTANNCVNPGLFEFIPKPFNSIDQAGMCATEKDHETFVGVYGESYVIGKRVGGP
jgi:hypothetical protein